MPRRSEVEDGEWYAHGAQVMCRVDVAPPLTGGNDYLVATINGNIHKNPVGTAHLIAERRNQSRKEGA